jgi:hypothetical protein
MNGDHRWRVERLGKVVEWHVGEMRATKRNKFDFEE